MAILVTLALIVNEITDAGQRRWWGAHSMTTDTVSGLLVLLITVLVVNQLLNLRQARQRSHAVAAQTAILLSQAVQSTRALSSVIGRTGDRGAASDAFRTFMLMLLISAPVFIDDPVARRFLEQAQVLAGIMASTLNQINKSTGGAAAQSDGLDGAMTHVHTAAAPLLQQLSPEVRASIQGLGQTAE